MSPEPSIPPAEDAGQTPGPESMARRSFIYTAITSIAGVITAMLAVPIVGCLLSPLLKDRREKRGLALVGPMDKFALNEPTVAAITFAGPGESPFTQGVYVINHGGNDVTMFSINCTHLGCPYEWNAPAQAFFCPCHGGTFDKDGQVTGGPPPRNLDAFEAVVKDGNLYAGKLITGKAKG